MDDSKREVTVRVPGAWRETCQLLRRPRTYNGSNISGSQPVALVSADFDSDGIADIVTADSSGILQLLTGVDPANFAIDPTGQKRAEPEPFSPVSTEASLGISPDLMFAGDFNADGKQDIVAATKGARNIILLGGNGSGQFRVPLSISVDGNLSWPRRVRSAFVTDRRTLQLRSQMKEARSSMFTSILKVHLSTVPKLSNSRPGLRLCTIGNIDETSIPTSPGLRRHPRDR